MDNKELFELSDWYLEIRSDKELTEQTLKDINVKLEEIESRLIEAMMNDELDNFKRNGVQFSLVNKSHLSAEAERKDELWAKMKEQGYEHLFSINAQTLSGEVKRLMEDNNGVMPSWLDGLIKQYEKPSIRVKK